MKLNLKLFIACLLAVFCAGNAYATIVWNSQTGYWANPALWDKGFVPNDFEDIKITRPAAICTVNSNVGNYSIAKIYLASGPDNANAATLKITDGGYLGADRELMIGSAGATGSGNIGYLIQTGGQLSTGSAGKIEVGYKTGGVGYYTMSGGSLTGDGCLFVGGAGANGAAGTFTVIGDDPFISLAKIYIGAKDSKGTYAGTGTVAFVVGAGGVSPIHAQSVYIDPMNNCASAANLLVTLSAAPPAGNIVLFDNTGCSPVFGKFDLINGIAAVEGASVTLGYGGVNHLYNLTYLYDAAGNGHTNDIALMTIPEPATIALLALGLLSVVKRH